MHCTCRLSGPIVPLSFVCPSTLHPLMPRSTQHSWLYWLHRIVPYTIPSLHISRYTPYSMQWTGRHGGSGWHWGTLRRSAPSRGLGRGKYIRVYIYIYIFLLFLFICMYVYIYIYIYICICMYSLSLSIYIYIYIYIYIWGGRSRRSAPSRGLGGDSGAGWDSVSTFLCFFLSYIHCLLGLGPYFAQNWASISANLRPARSDSVSTLCYVILVYQYNLSCHIILWHMFNDMLYNDVISYYVVTFSDDTLWRPPSSRRRVGGCTRSP